MSDRDVLTAANPANERSRIAPPANAGNRLLWFAVFAPPAAWSVDTLAAFAMHQDYCAALLGGSFKPWSGVGALLTIMGLVLLAVSLSAGVLAWRAHSALGSDDGRGDTDLDRRRFMARAALLSCTLFSYGMLLRIIAPLILPPNFCGS